MPHFGHVILVFEVMASVLVLTGVVIGRRDTYRRVVLEEHTRADIEPNDPVNMSFLLAFERTQAAPHNFCLNDDAAFKCRNM